MDSALGDLVADADDADGGRDDSEDDEEVLGRSYTKGAWGLSSKKRQQPRARVNAEGTHRATTIVFFLLSATLLTCADACTYMHVLTAQGADLQPEFANQSMG